MWRSLRWWRLKRREASSWSVRPTWKTHEWWLSVMWANFHCIAAIIAILLLLLPALEAQFEQTDNDYIMKILGKKVSLARRKAHFGANIHKAIVTLLLLADTNIHWWNGSPFPVDLDMDGSLSVTRVKWKIVGLYSLHTGLNTAFLTNTLTFFHLAVKCIFPVDLSACMKRPFYVLFRVRMMVGLAQDVSFVLPKVCVTWCTQLLCCIISISCALVNTECPETNSAKHDCFCIMIHPSLAKWNTASLIPFSDGCSCAVKAHQ